MENNLRELQLLPMAIPYTTPSYSPWPSDLLTFQSPSNDSPSLDLDLQLSTTLRLTKPPRVKKWRVPDHIQIAAMESAYVERVMEMTRREMEMAQLEFARAKHMWDRAREEMERVEMMKERATRRSGACLEITCQACRNKFRA